MAGSEKAKKLPLQLEGGLEGCTELNTFCAVRKTIGSAETVRKSIGSAEAGEISKQL
jgi:hypothetical protein